ncbi:MULTISPECIES: hypothetical protein [unclassified Herbaspirillum]|uniref:hypothetical protein n=1 Tax=unclassified Herbaspirillum TaxID=2624150 RepID=UPI001151E6EC|nr:MULTISPECIES: hypothetical protein [unclassified Herbaspirillum]MBB5389905.1 hypothetical protein [Herbaspirillum sp. SJZ102]
MKFPIITLILAVTLSSANAASLSLPTQQKEILCAVAIAGELEYRTEDLRAFAAVARGCMELSNAEKYGIQNPDSTRCLATLQRARESMNGKSIAVEEHAITAMCLNVLEAKSLDETILRSGKDAYIQDVSQNAIFRSIFCKQHRMSGYQCVLFYRELAGDTSATQ